MGVILNFMAYSVIQTTNSLTMKMLGTLRSIVTIGFGILVFKEVITIREVEGYMVALVGLVAYNMSSSGFFDKYAILQLTPDKAVYQLCTTGCAGPGELPMPFSTQDDEKLPFVGSPSVMVRKEVVD